MEIASDDVRQTALAAMTAELLQKMDADQLGAIVGKVVEEVLKGWETKREIERAVKDEMGRFTLALIGPGGPMRADFEKAVRDELSRRIARIPEKISLGF